MPEGEAIGPARFGLTVTKKLGNAVKRNRIRRRLKDAIRRGAIELAQPGFDYVVIAREAALVRAFNVIENDLRVALGKVHKEPPGANGPRRSHGPRGDKSNRPGREPGTDGGRI